jgi:glutaredoxin
VHGVKELMKYLFILIALFGFYEYVYKPSTIVRPSNIKVSESGQYIAVYGRNSCPITKKTLAYMKENGIKHAYLNIDDEAIAANLHQQMKDQGISTQRYNLPVVDFSGELSIRPTNTTILDSSNIRL